MKQQLSGVLRGFSAKQRAVINRLNARYTYDHVSFFRQTIYEVLMNNDISHLNEDQLHVIADFILVMLKLIDCPYQTFSIKSILKSKPFEVQNKPVNSIEKRKKIKTELSKALTGRYIEWISGILAQRNVSTLSLLNSYYSHFHFDPKLLDKSQSHYKQWFI